MHRAHAHGHLATKRDRVDADHIGARGMRSLHHDLPRHAEAENHNKVAEADTRVMHTVKRHRAYM